MSTGAGQPIEGRVTAARKRNRENNDKKGMSSGTGNNPKTMKK